MRSTIILILATIALLSTSCRKELRLDMYIESVRVLEIPDQEWDQIILKDPDLRLDMSLSSDADWQHSTQTAQEVGSTPTVVYFTSPVLVSDADWKFRLMDDDLEPIDTDDEIYMVSALNPVRIGRKGIIEIEVGGIVVMEINYNLQ